MDKNVCIVHFNTPTLTRAAIRSVLKHTPDCKITVFDNSDLFPFGEMDGVSILDNTSGQLIDFEKMFFDYPDRVNSDNGYGSAKHCKSVDYLMDLFDCGFLLLDSDVIVIKDISSLFNDGVIWIGQPHISRKHRINIPRLYPFCCYINTRMCRENHIRYFNGNYMWQLSSRDGQWYDTGAWFLKATKNFPYKIIRYSDYVIHYGGGSFRKDKKETQEDWLCKYRKYYE